MLGGMIHLHTTSSDGGYASGTEELGVLVHVEWCAPNRIRLEDARAEIMDESERGSDEACCSWYLGASARRGVVSAAEVRLRCGPKRTRLTRGGSTGSRPAQRGRSGLGRIHTRTLRCSWAMKSALAVSSACRVTNEPGLVFGVFLELLLKPWTITSEEFLDSFLGLFVFCFVLKTLKRTQISLTGLFERRDGKLREVVLVLEGDARGFH